VGLQKGHCKSLKSASSPADSGKVSDVTSIDQLLEQMVQ
jgi:hypothetical protein